MEHYWRFKLHQIVHINTSKLIPPEREWQDENDNIKDVFVDSCKFEMLRLFVATNWSL